MKETIDSMIEFEFDESENMNAAIAIVKKQIRNLRISNFDSIAGELQCEWAKSP